MKLESVETNKKPPLKIRTDAVDAVDACMRVFVCVVRCVFREE